MKKNSKYDRPRVYIWLPPRSVGEKAFLNDASCIVMMAASGSARYHRTSLDALDSVKSATLVLDGRDVTLLRASLPNLAGSKLAKALPNAVEDLLLQDAAACALVIGPRVAGGTQSMVGAVDRSWLDLVVAAIERRGVRIEAVVPAHLVLPLPSDSIHGWAMACYQGGLAIRTSVDSGFGWGAGEDTDFKMEAIRSALLAARQSTETFASGESPDLAVYIEDESWQVPATQVLEQVKLRASISSLPIPQIDDNCIDFLAERSGSKGGRFLKSFDWRAWRIPVLATGVAAACFIAGLNLHWGQLAQERDRLKSETERRFRQAFPQTQVVIDPLLQMQRNVATLRAQAGQAGPEDFSPLIAKLSSALATVPPMAGTSGPVRAAEALQTLDYRANKLKIKFTSGLMDSRNNRNAVSAVAARYGLKFEFENDGVVVVGTGS